MTTVLTHIPKVSILIPVFNRKDFIAVCIQSALGQTYTDFEIVVADNASDDGTWEICQQFAAKDQRVRVFRNDTNVGPVRNWLRCVSESRGEYGKILFSDDLMYSHFLERTLPYLEDAEVAFVSTSAHVGLTPGVGDVMYENPFDSEKISSDSYFDFLVPSSYFQVPFSPGAAIFRMTDIRQNLRPSIPTNIPRDFAKNGAGPDVLLFALTALNYKSVVMLAGTEVFFRKHADSFTIDNQDNEVFLGYRAALAWFCKNNLSERHWAMYVAWTWLSDIKRTHRLKTLGEYARRYEGRGSIAESIAIAMALPRIIASRLQSHTGKQ